MQYKRILLKLSGESLGDGEVGISEERVMNIAKDIAECTRFGIQIAIVVGGGNMWRGREHPTMDHSIADKIGMLGTIMNALTLNNALISLGVKSTVETSVEMNAVCDFYNRDKCVKELENGSIVIFGGGTGNPYFSTDSAASLRAAEINADLVLKATNVDGVYTADPNKDKSATKYDKLTYLEVISKRLNVMDTTAISLCMDNDIPIIVFNNEVRGNLKKIILGENIGTLVSKG